MGGVRSRPRGAAGVWKKANFPALASGQNFLAEKSGKAMALKPAALVLSIPDAIKVASARWRRLSDARGRQEK